jgi:ferrous iron transport protein A
MSHVKTIHNLSELKPGQSAVIEGFDEDKVPIKILEMGLLPGNTVLVKRLSPFGDPMHIRVVGFDLALRKDEAAFVKVAPLPTEKSSV